MSRDAHLAMTVSTKFEVDTTIRYSVIAANTLRDVVTLTFDLLTLVSGHTRRVTWSTPWNLGGWLVGKPVASSC